MHGYLYCISTRFLRYRIDKFCRYYKFTLFFFLHSETYYSWMNVCMFHFHPYMYVNLLTSFLWYLHFATLMSTKSFQCLQCCKRCGNAGALKSHMKTHKKPEPKSGSLLSFWNVHPRKKPNRQLSYSLWKKNASASTLTKSEASSDCCLQSSCTKPSSDNFGDIWKRHVEVGFIAKCDDSEENKLVLRDDNKTSFRYLEIVFEERKDKAVAAR